MSDLPSAALPRTAAELHAMAQAVTPMTAVTQRVDCSHSNWFEQACSAAAATFAASGRTQMAAALHAESEPAPSPAQRLQTLLRLVRLEIRGVGLAPWGPSWFPLGSADLDRVVSTPAPLDSHAEILWQTERMLDGIHLHPPVVLGEQLLCASISGIEVLSTRNGQSLGRTDWSEDLGKGVSGPAIVYDGCYVQARQNGRLYGYDCGSGLPRLRWSSPMSGAARSMSGLAASGSVVAVLVVSDRIPFLSAYDLFSGAHLWIIELPERYHATEGPVGTPLIFDQKVCVAFGNMVQLRHLSTGRLIWQRRHLAHNRLGPERNLISSVARRGNRLYVVTDDSALLELADDNGELLQEYASPVGPLCPGVTFLNGSPVVLAQETGVPLHLQNGTLRSIYAGSPERCTTPPWSVGERIVWLSRLGRLHCSGTPTGPGWSIPLPVRFATPKMSVVDGTFYFLSGTGHLCAARSPS